MNDSSKLIGEQGSRYWDSADGANTDQTFMIIVIEAAVFSAITEEDKDTTGVNAMTEQNITGKTLPAGAQITPKRRNFDGFTLTSGKVMIYRGF